MNDPSHNGPVTLYKRTLSNMRRYECSIFNHDVHRYILFCMKFIIEQKVTLQLNNNIKNYPKFIDTK